MLAYNDDVNIAMGIYLHSGGIASGANFDNIFKEVRRNESEQSGDCNEEYIIQINKMLSNTRDLQDKLQESLDYLRNNYDCFDGYTQGQVDTLLICIDGIGELISKH